MHCFNINGNNQPIFELKQEMPNLELPQCQMGYGARPPTSGSWLCHMPAVAPGLSLWMIAAPSSGSVRHWEHILAHSHHTPSTLTGEKLNSVAAAMAAFPVFSFLQPTSWEVGFESMPHAAFVIRTVKAEGKTSNHLVVEQFSALREPSRLNQTTEDAQCTLLYLQSREEPVATGVLLIESPRAMGLPLFPQSLSSRQR